MFAKRFDRLDVSLPIEALGKAIRQVPDGAEVAAVADDPAFGPDVEKWCAEMGHRLIFVRERSGKLVAVIRKEV